MKILRPSIHASQFGEHEWLIRRAVFHGVNNRFTLLWDRLWEKGETRNSQLVFIGKEIDEARIRQHLEQCIVK